MRYGTYLLLGLTILFTAACEEDTTPPPTPPAGQNGAAPAAADGKPTSLILPDEISSPDGMTVGSDGRIYVSMLNLEVDAPAAIWTIDADNPLAKFIDLPGHPDSGKAFPLGIAEGSDGHFYVADNQSFTGDQNHKARVLRIVVESGKPVRVETVATGFIDANAVVAFKDRIYVTETTLIAGSDPHVSGLYKFDIAELDAANPVQLEPDGEDPHLLAQFTTTAPDWRKEVGANGLTIAPDGRLFVCNFGEASVLSAPLKDDGLLDGELKVIVQGNGMDSTDGIRYLPERDQLVIADFFANAVHLVDVPSGEVTTLAKNGNSDGSASQLDKCSEPCVRGDVIYVANIDLPRDGNVPDKPHSLVMIPLPGK